MSTKSGATGGLPPRTGVPHLARTLALAGAIPFVAGAVLLWIGSVGGLSGDFVSGALKSYSAVILSFLGGVHWGLALAAPDTRFRDRELLFSIVPAVVSWVAVLFAPGIALMVLAIAFLLQGLFDIWIALKDHAPNWYARLRAEMTLIVCVLLLVAWAAL
ncbi:DUF3429 domain-containing protein [Amorphus coralli]|uniref:DUF3429 domain-containing protein n=1 Tax=Amorphus coralli TaxID=340680 RepID=UPI00037C9FC0|nr:DUF3429 domain-containing protein [Amorphus coralli]